MRKMLLEMLLLLLSAPGLAGAATVYQYTGIVAPPVGQIVDMRPLIDGCFDGSDIMKPACENNDAPTINTPYAEFTMWKIASIAGGAWAETLGDFQHNFQWPNEAWGLRLAWVDCREVVNGVVTRCNLKSALITTYDGRYTDTDGDGVFDFYDYWPHDPTKHDRLNDADGDTIPDIYDPYPDSDEPFKFEIIGWNKRADGVTVGYMVRMPDGTIFKTGDWSDQEGGHKEMVVGKGKEWDSSLWGELFPGGYNPDGSSGGDLNYNGPQGKDAESNSATGIDKEGNDGSAASTETDLLKAIAENTNDALKNDQRLADYIKAVGESIEEMHSDMLAGFKSVSGGDSEGGGEGLELPDDDSGGRSEWGEPGTGDPSGAVDPADYAEFVANQEGTTWFSDFVEMLPISQIMGDAAINTSGSCTMQFNVLGDTRTLSLCEFQAGFETAGNLLFGLCSLAGIIVILRR